MCSKLLSFLVSVLLCRNVLLCFWATVSALVCLVCSSTVVRNYDDDDDDDDEICGTIRIEKADLVHTVL